MIKTVLMSAGVFLTLNTFAQETGNYTIKGQIEGLKTGKAYLVTSSDQGQKIDSVAITNGSFTLSDTISEPKPASLIVSHDALNSSKNLLVLEKGSISVAGNVNNPAFVKISGTESNDMLTQYDAQSNKGDTAWMTNFEKKYIAAKEANNDSLLTTYEEEFENNAKANASIAEKIISERPAAYAAPILLSTTIGLLEITRINELLQEIEKAGNDNALTRQLREITDKKLVTATGTLAPDIIQKDTTGQKDITLSSLKGKYVLLDFWASWCGPCRAENPNIVAAYNKFKDKNFTIFSVSLDDESKNGKENWIGAIQKDGLVWPNHVSDLKGWANAAAEKYGVRAIPANFLIDPEGKIIATDLRGSSLQSKLEELLK